MVTYWSDPVAKVPVLTWTYTDCEGNTDTWAILHDRIMSFDIAMLMASIVDVRLVQWQWFGSANGSW
jgi:hypothetical protein